MNRRHPCKYLHKYNNATGTKRSESDAYEKTTVRSYVCRMTRGLGRAAGEDPPGVLLLRGNPRWKAICCCDTLSWGMAPPFAAGRGHRIANGLLLWFFLLSCAIRILIARNEEGCRRIICLGKIEILMTRVLSKETKCLARRLERFRLSGFWILLLNEISVLRLLCFLMNIVISRFQLLIIIFRHFVQVHQSHPLHLLFHH